MSLRFRQPQAFPLLPDPREKVGQRMISIHRGALPRAGSGQAHNAVRLPASVACGEHHSQNGWNFGHRPAVGRANHQSLWEPASPRQPSDRRHASRPRSPNMGFTQPLPFPPGLFEGGSRGSLRIGHPAKLGRALSRASHDAVKVAPQGLQHGRSQPSGDRCPESSKAAPGPPGAILGPSWRASSTRPARRSCRALPFWGPQVRHEAGESVFEGRRRAL